MASRRAQIVILGAGPAGVGAAARLGRRHQFDITVLERGSGVGGNAGSFDLDGQAVDYGSHRLHPACEPHILDDIRAMLGADLLDRPRHGRIRLRGRWVHFPLKPLDLALNLPASFMMGVAKDSLFRAQNGHSTATFATVLEQGLGRTICRDFYFPYAEKIWGMPPSELDAEQARRRVSANSTGKMAQKVLKMIPGLKPKGAGRFFYPRGGYGAITQAYYRAAVDDGVVFRFNAEVQSVQLKSNHIASVTVQASPQDEIPADLVLSTIPLPALARAVEPSAPAAVLEPAGELSYRAMILIYLVLEADRFSEFDAHYFPEPDVAITRLSEPKNYGLTHTNGSTVLCAELPCSPDDSSWSMTDDQLGRLVQDALAKVGLPVRAPIRRVVTRRLRQAYPIYTQGYKERFDALDAWVGGLGGLVTLGRQGLFAHDNTHHALAMAYAVADCVDDAGDLDVESWAHHRRRFESHVVED